MGLNWNSCVRCAFGKVANCCSPRIFRWTAAWTVSASQAEVISPALSATFPDTKRAPKPLIEEHRSATLACPFVAAHPTQDRVGTDGSLRLRNQSGMLYSRDRPAELVTGRARRACGTRQGRNHHKNRQKRPLPVR